MSNRPMPASSTLRSREDSIARGLDKLWNDAAAKYEEETGHRLTFVDGFPSESRNPDEIIEFIVKQSDSLKASRAVGERIRRVLKPIVNVVLLFLDAGAEAGSKAAPGGKAIFGAIGVLLRATKGVSGIYDAVEALLQRVTDYFQHVSDLLDASMPPTPALTNILVETLVQLFIALALATKHCSIAAKRELWFEKAMRVIFWRTKDYFTVIVGKTDVVDALRTLEALAKKELLVIVTQTYAMASEVQRKADVERLSSWLNPPKRLPNNYENKRRDGSCAWFFDATFREWKNQKDGMYWVSGTAGTGKSVLWRVLQNMSAFVSSSQPLPDSSSVIDALKEDSTLLLAYFYFDYSDAVKKDSGSSGLLSSLVFQIGTAYDEGIAYLKSKHSSHPPTPTMLLDLLSQLLRLSGCTCIIIDALDECPEPERAHRGLFGFLRRLRDLQQGDSVDLRVLVASRPEPDLRDRMPQLATHLLTDFQGVPEHAVEIGCHIESQLFGEETQSLYSNWSVDIKREAQAVMIKKSNGMFLWVDIVLRYLRRCDPCDVLNVLSELPADLHKIYERILNDFPPSRAMTVRAHRVLEVVAFAKRPLYLDEVMAIFSADLNVEHGP
ncbi:hypothetical protein PENSPDRAFT_683734 [Peniophora sp. CONT]|nr:hypothetical protein PENSPDRAFT_683734 [Peniophora sp. CONT]